MEYWIIGVLEKRKSITPLLQYTKKTKNIEQGTSIKTNYEYRMPNAECPMSIIERRTSIVARRTTNAQDGRFTLQA